MFVHVLVTAFALRLAFGLPSMRDSLTNPVHVYEGDDALITCVVRNIADNTLMWKKEDRERHSRRVLTVDDKRVTADRRFAVLHDSSEDMMDMPSGGDVWVLVIKKAKPTDSGIYVCEVNSNPIVRSFHKLSVLSKGLQPPNNITDPILFSADDMKPTPFASKNHNYTDCCLLHNVSANCIGFCNIQSILEGSTGQDPENCESAFPAIVKCMADGRNHVPCCIQERVPDICQDVCRGEYTAITDNIKTHFSCSSYTEQTLACIVEGIELLPSPPEDLQVEAITEKSLLITWTLPFANTETITNYLVNVTSLRSFDEDDAFDVKDDDSGTISNAHTIQVKVPASQNTTTLNSLSPFTMYEVTVTALNKHGSSLPSYSVRTLTQTPGKMSATQVGEAPQLPDIKACCVRKGVTQKTCVSKLCDPAEADTLQIPDLMICAPWVSVTFGCLANGIDHTPCCQARGLPAICQHLCTGNVSSIDFNYFKCLRYMGEYTNCLLQGYGVLPSAPVHLRISNIETEFAILHWAAPKTLGDTVMSYNLHYRSVEEDDEYRAIPKVKSPYILEALESDTDYEIYVEAVNTHGVGPPSARITFTTESKIAEEKIEEASVYNVTSCCVEADLSSVCLPLCSYDANMTDIKHLAGVCGAEFHKLLRCGAGGRNHEGCCKRRGVPNACLSLCSGVVVDSLIVMATTCVAYIGNIAQCFEEGTGLLPGPISELHATVVDDTTVLLEWEPPVDGSNVTDYVVHYPKVENNTETNPQLDQQMNVSQTTVTLTNLQKDATYHMFVVSRNQHGTSLPSSMIVMKLVKVDAQWVKAVTSAPHSLAVASHSANWVTISWQPPEFSHPNEKIDYQLYYKSNNEDNYHLTNVSVTSHMIEGLNPNTQYIVYVTAVTDKGPSSPSETLIAWTDPAYPAFVEPPTVHPINLVIEGSSMTILCIAMGTPMPTISLYLSGRLVRQETTRHMVTVVHNVTRDMNQISCYADNGYGTPMQASRKITISHLPHIQAAGITMANLGDSVTLTCRVAALPEPKMIFWRNFEQRTPVINGGKYEISTSKAKDEDAKYIMQLTIKQIGDMDVGDYFCHAENAFGSATQPVSVRIRNVAAMHNVTQCCIEQNVTAPCMDACSFFLDMDAVIDRPECINDFDKLMKCAADGSDHRACCTQWGVPRRCLDWCRGEAITNNKICVLSYTKPIMSCFHEGRDKLPGPPLNVHVEFMDAHSVTVRWEPPLKNPHTVELYRVFWRLVDSANNNGDKNDTAKTSIRIGGLKDGGTYECVVKAGNSKGTSTLSEAVRFTMGEKYITSAASHSEEGGHVGVVWAVVLALGVVGAIVGGAVWFVRYRRLAKCTNGVAFENPSYLREVESVEGVAEGGVSAVSGGGAWRSEALHVPAMATEVNPTLYEELKLGQDGAGFKRLKS